MHSFQASLAVKHVKPESSYNANLKSAMGSVVDSIADTSALVRLAIVAIQAVDDTDNSLDPATLASVITTLSIAEQTLARVHNRCDSLAMQTARASLSSI